MNSIRRYLIDKNLISHVNLFNDKLILDAGGRKNSNRGEFNKEKTNYQKWVYLNLDPMTKPDIVGDISKTNFKNEQFDVVLLIEVIEYLNDPSKVFLEINRILKKNGQLIITVPFLNPLHGDKEFDLARYTEASIKKLSKNSLFKIEKLEIMGSSIAVIFDILRVTFSYKKNIFFKIFYIFLLILRPVIIYLYKNINFKNEYINTGYFVILKKI
tara:strand:+ start:22 stop:663 length:642 start_codon:yes stop_codon:yes gene_type:complete